MDWKHWFTNKRVTVMGIDPEGRGLRDALFCAAHGAVVTATDTKLAAELGDSAQKLRDAGVALHLGGHTESDFTDTDLVIRAGSAPKNSPYLAAARKAGVRIETDETLFLALAPKITVVGVTGTRGKSTTTHLLYEILRKWKPGQAHIAGNVRGVAALPLLQDVAAGDYAVLELASWQLQQFGENHKSPDVAVFTTFMPDHLNYYDGDLSAYLADKANIFLNQPKDTGVLIIGEQAENAIKEKYAWDLPAHTVIARTTAVPSSWKPLLIGEHNRANIACAYEAAKALGVGEKTIADAVESFRGVPGRLERIREKNGVQIFNDTTATTPEATIAALRALEKEYAKKIVLIMGGADKGIAPSALLPLLPDLCKKVILLAGSGTEKILPYVQEKIPGTQVYTDFASAVHDALAASTSGDVVILSPAFASFGMFKNEFDRGDQFIALTK